MEHYKAVYSSLCKTDNALIGLNEPIKLCDIPEDDYKLLVKLAQKLHSTATISSWYQLILNQGESGRQ